MKLQTKNLTGAALDWCVSVAEGVTVGIFSLNVYPHLVRRMDNGANYTPSTNWAQGGPIIEREHIALEHWPTRAIHPNFKGSPEGGNYHSIRMEGDTLLIAAMRCYVASKLGAEVEVPNELQIKE